MKHNKAISLGHSASLRTSELQRNVPKFHSKIKFQDLA